MSLVILSVSEVSTLRSLWSRLSLNLALNLKCKLHFKVWIFRFLTKAQNDKVLPARHCEQILQIAKLCFAINKTPTNAFDLSKAPKFQGAKS